MKDGKLGPDLNQLSFASGILTAPSRRQRLAEEGGNRILYGSRTQNSSQYSSSRDVAVTTVTSPVPLLTPQAIPSLSQHLHHLPRAGSCCSLI